MQMVHTITATLHPERVRVAPYCERRTFTVTFYAEDRTPIGEPEEVSAVVSIGGCESAASFVQVALQRRAGTTPRFMLSGVTEPSTPPIQDCELPPVWWLKRDLSGDLNSGTYTFNIGEPT